MEWRQRFREVSLPIIDDDIKSQMGATITHRVLARLFEDRGVRIDCTYELNFGDNTDFMKLLERERLESKKISKTVAVTSQISDELDPKNVHVGPSDYVRWLTDRKWCHIRNEPLRQTRIRATGPTGDPSLASLLLRLDARRRPRGQCSVASPH